MDRAKAITGKLGINRAVFFFLVGKAFSSLAAPVTLYLIASYFSPLEQGYYYTFSSLLGLSIFFELGFGTIIGQFASHEYANLSWNNNGGLTGEPSSLSRIISLLRKSLLWYSVVVVLFIACLIPGGILFFGSKHESASLHYVLPWVLLIVFFGLNTCFIPITSVIEGCGRVADIQKLRILQAVGSVLVVWTTIFSGGRLFAASFEFTAYWFVILFWLLVKYRGLIGQILHHDIRSADQVSWLKEVFPMQWRIAVSWLSAYFMNYLFTPLLFIYRTPAEAGKMGMSLKVGSFVFMLSMAWINSRVPSYGAIIKKKNYAELDSLASRTTLQAVCAGMFFTLLIIGLIVMASGYTEKNYLDRVLPLPVIVAICLANVFMTLNSSIAGYLRAHKQEPLMIASVLIAMLTAATCWITAKYFDANVMAIAYAGIQVLVAAPIMFAILLRKRAEWHGISTSENVPI